MRRINNIDYLRLLLAFLVFFQHSIELGGFGYPYFHTLYGSKFAVDSFFILSGFLIYQSFDKSPSLKGYFAKRLFRIYPAYIFSIIFFSVLIYFLFTSVTLSAVFKYVSFQIPFLNSAQPIIKGAFEHNKVNAINGALWTLKIELTFYIFVPLFHFIASKKNLLKTILFLFISSVLWSFCLNQIQQHHHVPEFLFHQFPSQLKYFATGIFIFYITRYDKFKIASVEFLLISIILYILGCIFIEENILFRPLFIGFLIYSIVFYKHQLHKLNFDFSYGLYVIHFPILQLFYNFYNTSWLLTFFWCLILVFGLAAFMWNYIEKPFIKKSLALASKWDQIKN